MFLSNYMKILTALLVTALLLSGCGYSNPYATPTDSQDKGDRIPLYLEMWDDEANLLGYQAVIQRSLVNWLKKSKQFKLVSTIGDAQHKLSGIIHYADFPGLSYGTFDRAVELRAKIKFSYALKSLVDNSTLLEKKEFIILKSYPVGSSSVETEDNKQHALQEMANELAEEIYIELSYILIPKKQGA